MDEDTAKKVITWTHDIRHLFTQQDVTCMLSVSAGVIDLHSYDSVSHNAAAILGQVEAGNMPPAHSGEKTWPPDRVQLFRDWIKGGKHR
jgi:hypothetical protein